MSLAGSRSWVALPEPKVRHHPDPVGAGAPCSTFCDHRRRASGPARPPKRRGSRTQCTDACLTDRIRRVLGNAAISGEGSRKVRARLRHDVIGATTIWTTLNRMGAWVVTADRAGRSGGGDGIPSSRSFRFDPHKQTPLHPPPPDAAGVVPEPEKRRAGARRSAFEGPVSGEPAVRSDFDVYPSKDTLIYAKEPCTGMMWRRCSSYTCIRWNGKTSPRFAGSTALTNWTSNSTALCTTEMLRDSPSSGVRHHRDQDRPVRADG